MAHRWYVVHVYSGNENKVAESIIDKARKNGLEEKFEQVLVPTHEVMEVRRGKKVATEKKFFPGYVLVKMVLDDDAWHMVQNLPKVTGFLGSKGRPCPISQKEAERLMHQVEEGVNAGRDGLMFDVGEQVRVCDGPFSSFNGIVEEVDDEKARLKVTVSIFGRATPVDLDFTQVEKI
ncbi:MAG: transcription termination/antitermination protein NusG [Alphaproteobacteria bacterium]|nr:transcription termination/antitermination protein NusG [Alphaproteobacteria bacterium]